VSYSCITDYVAQERIDPALTKLGREQATLLQEHAQHTRPQLIIVSPLLRAVETAVIGFAKNEKVSSRYI
jgi:broad specificity phosphatase PhoE